MESIRVDVAGICFKDDKVLILKRNPEKRLYPSLWECGGGKIEAGESLEEAIRREVREETGYTVQVKKLLGTYTIPLDKGCIPGVRFLCRITEDKDPVISEEHTEYKFISIDKIDNYEFIEGIKQEIKDAYKIINLK